MTRHLLTGLCVIMGLSACSGPREAYLPASWPPERLQGLAVRWFQHWKDRYVRYRALPADQEAQAYVDYLADVRTDPGFDWGDRQALTVSEAHGYGMRAVTLMARLDPAYKAGAARSDFEAMARLFLSFPSKGDSRLMTWRLFDRGIDPLTGEGASGTMDPSQRDYSATDGDMDIALAFLEAQDLWPEAMFTARPGDPPLSWGTMALRVIAGLRERCLDRETGLLLLGDWVTEPGNPDAATFRHGTRTSDFMPAHLERFAKAEEGADPAAAALWRKAAALMIAAVESCNKGPSARTGLMPDFMVEPAPGALPVPVRGTWLEDEHDGDWNWNACRVPWRLGMAWLELGHPALEQVLADGTRWVRMISKDDPGAIPAGAWVVGGTPGQALPGRNWSDLSFVSPWLVAALGQKDQPAWTGVLLDHLEMVLEVGGQGYFPDSITLLCLLESALTAP